MKKTLMLTLTLTFAACGDDDVAVTLTTDAAADSSEECSRGIIEPDLESAPLAGSAVADGVLKPGSYLYSTTYLQLRQEPKAQQRFGELMQGILAELQTRPGLLAISLGTSRSCGIARTLSVWQDDVAMLGFVTSAAHSAAIGSVTEVSRGGSLVTHWSGDASDATWQSAAEHAIAEDGPFY
jgi:hypothetical protein